MSNNNNNNNKNKKKSNDKNKNKNKNKNNQMLTYSWSNLAGPSTKGMLKLFRPLYSEK